MTVLVFPDAEQIHADALRTWLQAQSGHSDVQVVVREPDTLPARFVKVRRTGGPRDTWVTDSPRIQYTAWGTDDVDSHDLAQLVRAFFLWRLKGTVQAGVPVYQVTEIGGPVPTSDPETGRPQYFGTVETRLRGAEQ